MARLRPSPVIPAAVVALSVRDEPKSAIQYRADPRVARHSVSLAKHEGRQAVVVHIALRIRDI